MENIILCTHLGIIFSGIVKGLDINFINPLPKGQKTHYELDPKQNKVDDNLLNTFYITESIVNYVRNKYGLTFNCEDDESLGTQFKINIGYEGESCDSNNCIRFVWTFNGKKYELHYGDCGNAKGRGKDYLAQDKVYVGLYVWEDGVFTRVDTNYKKNWYSVKDDLVENYGFPDNVDITSNLPYGEIFQVGDEDFLILPLSRKPDITCPTQGVEVTYRNSSTNTQYTLELCGPQLVYGNGLVLSAGDIADEFGYNYNGGSQDVDGFELVSQYDDYQTWTYKTTYNYWCRLSTGDPLSGQEVGRVYKSVAEELAPTISKWYKTLRTIALVGLLSVLVYISIRMIISSSSKDSAKYKKMFVDWLVAICLIFILHYVMAFILQTISSINNFFPGYEDGVDKIFSNIRYEADKSYSVMQMFASTVMYVALVVLTCTFTIQYLKRVIYMAFLTMIAPLICLTYPLDKVKDGQAQALSMWLREYIFNALLQPMHLIIYTLLIRYC